jgi:16S rRNA processing protein RimM
MAGRLVEIGRFGAPYALAGGLKFRGEPVVAHLTRIYVEGHGWRAVEDLYQVGEELVVHLAGVSTRELAEALVGLRVYAEVAYLPPLEEGQYYYFALIGLPVYVEGQKVGEVADILDAGGPRRAGDPGGWGRGSGTGPSAWCPSRPLTCGWRRRASTWSPSPASLTECATPSSPSFLT